MTHLPDELYRRNLTALRLHQLEVAGFIDSAKIPPDITPAIGRDGSPTFIVTGGRGQPEWFGGSSMPRTSAEEMFGHVRSDGGSATLPGMLTGAEVLVVARQLGTRCAVFVIEGSSLALKLAMHLYEYVELIRDGRLVFIPATDVVGQVREFFTGNPGYELPGTLFKAPQRTAGEIVELQQSIERSGGEAMRIQAGFVAACARRIRERLPRIISQTPSLCVATTGTNQGLARALARAAISLGWSAEICVGDRPAQRHAAARLMAIDGCGAGMAVYVGGVSAAERAMLPDELPVIHLFDADVSLVAKAHPRVAPFDLFLVGSRAGREWLEAAGIASEQIAPFEPAADVLPDEALPTATANASAAVFMDLPDDRPQACGISLPSQIALWEALQRRVLHHADDYADALSEAILQHAQRDSGTELIDAGARETFAALLRSRIAPATVARAAVGALVKKRIMVSVWGANWPALGRGRDVRRGPIPAGGSALRAIIGRGGVCVVPWFSRAGVRTAVEALAGEAVVVMRGSNEMLVHEFPALAELSRFIHFFQSGDALAGTLRGVERDRERFALAARDARRTVLERHTLAARMRDAATWVRGRRNPAWAGRSPASPRSSECDAVPASV